MIHSVYLLALLPKRVPVFRFGGRRTSEAFVLVRRDLLPIEERMAVFVGNGGILCI